VRFFVAVLSVMALAAKNDSYLSSITTSENRQKCVDDVLLHWLIISLTTNKLNAYNWHHRIDLFLRTTLFLQVYFVLPSWKYCHIYLEYIWKIHLQIFYLLKLVHI
jgi:hypothetical protein